MFKKIIIPTTLLFILLIITPVLALEYSIEDKSPPASQGNCRGDCYIMVGGSDEKNTCVKHGVVQKTESVEVNGVFYESVDEHCGSGFACCEKKVAPTGGNAEGSQCTNNYADPRGNCAFGLVCLPGTAAKPIATCVKTQSCKLIVWRTNDPIDPNDQCCPLQYTQQEMDKDPDCKCDECAKFWLDSVPQEICKLAGGNPNSLACKGLMTTADQEWKDLISSVTGVIEWLNPQKWTTSFCNPNNPLRSSNQNSNIVYSCDGGTCTPVLTLGGERETLKNVSGDYYIYTFKWMVAGGETNYTYKVSLQNGDLPSIPSERNTFAKPKLLEAGGTDNKVIAVIDQRQFTHVCIYFYDEQGNSPKEFPFTGGSSLSGNLGTLFSPAREQSSRHKGNENVQYKCRLLTSSSQVVETQPVALSSPTETSGTPGGATYQTTDEIQFGG